MAIKPKTFTLNRDLYFGTQRREGDAVTGRPLAVLLRTIPHVLDESKPPQTNTKPPEDEEVG